MGEKKDRTPRDRRDKDSEKRREAKDADREESRRDRDYDREEGSRRKERDREKNKENTKDRDRDENGKKSRRDRDDAEKSKDEPQKETIQPKESTKEIEERIARMKEARAKEKTAQRRKEEDDVLAWVQKSRKIEKEKRKPVLSIAAQEDDDEEEDVDTKHLAGVKIRHGFEKFVEGGPVVLTLKDTSILAGDDINQEADELENVNIAEQKAREEAYRSAKKKPGLYDEDRFQNDINTVKTLLPQYDGPAKDEGILLDESGGINEDSQKRLEEVRQRLQGAALKVESLLGSGNKTSDYYTEEEMLKFKKPKKVKKLRKKDMIDVDALETEAKAAGLGGDDLGSRSTVQKPKDEEGEDPTSRYVSAFAKAFEASKALREEKKDIVEEPIEEEEDELHKRLQRSRELALKQRAESAMLGPQAIAARISEYKEEEPDNENASEKAVIITETEEFCLSLQPDEAISQRDNEDEDHENSRMDAMEIDHNEETENVENNDDKEEDEVVMEPAIKEVAVGKGLAGALKLLQERGALKESVEWGGRNMDKKASKLIGVVDDYEAPVREINLDRRDEYGRTMTPKEAFRQLSHKFHGKGPGKAKLEKKLKQHEEELKRKQMAAGDTPLKSMEKLREAQAKTKCPYIPVSGHIKPGQTSDPRSGFATVEKEQIGSLTPMLGDKKVEHFLGIKRRPGDMGPPLPKKPKT